MHLLVASDHHGGPLSLRRPCWSETQKATQQETHFSCVCAPCFFFRQAFSQVLSSNETFAAPMDETYKLLGMNPSEVTTLEGYLGEFYSRILSKLKEVGGQSRQRDFYL